MISQNLEHRPLEMIRIDQQMVDQSLQFHLEFFDLLLPVVATLNDEMEVVCCKNIHAADIPMLKDVCLHCKSKVLSISSLHLLVHHIEIHAYLKKRIPRGF